MTIQSLGVGSGLDLDGLVQQLIAAERQPKESRLNEKEERVEAEISGLAKVKSKLSGFQDIVGLLERCVSAGRQPWAEICVVSHFLTRRSQRRVSIVP